MANKFLSERNLKFLLHEVCAAEELCKLAFFADHDRESFDMMLDTAVRMADQLLFPAFRDLDLNPPELVDGQVRVRPVVSQFLEQCGQAAGSRPSFPMTIRACSCPSWSIPPVSTPSPRPTSPPRPTWASPPARLT